MLQISNSTNVGIVYLFAVGICYSVLRMVCAKLTQKTKQKANSE